MTTHWDGLLLDGRLATLAGNEGYGLVEHGALAWKDGAIVFAGPQSELPGAPEKLAAEVASVLEGDRPDEDDSMGAERAFGADADGPEGLRSGGAVREPRPSRCGDSWRRSGPRTGTGSRSCRVSLIREHQTMRPGPVPESGRSAGGAPNP